MIHTYENLVYCCASVNIAKSDDHSCEYLDPCDIDFNKDFARNCFGRIIIRSDAPHQKIAQHMYERMKLYLTKYALIWWLDRLTILDKLKLGNSKNSILIISVFKSFR